MGSMKYIGEILIQLNVITEAELDDTLQTQKNEGFKRLTGEILIASGICSEAEVLQALSQQLTLPLLDTVLAQMGEDDIDLVRPVSTDLPFTWWLKNEAFPLFLKKNTLFVAKENLFDEFVAESVRQELGFEYQVVLTSHYEFRKLAQTLENPDHEKQDISSGEESSSAPIIKLVNSVIQQAVDAKASDIHFEVFRGVFRVRIRIDGVLQEVDRPSLALHAAVISRVKLMAGLDISEKRLPLDGRIRVKLSGKNIDIRVATTPTVYGENVVMRLLVNEQQSANQHKELAMFPDHMTAMYKLTEKKEGIFLVTGPTGSGKTTSLYTLLSKLNDIDTKIITVEDPVEYQMPGLTQIQVNSDIGLHFSTVLRSALRQDPDIILIGEMRDKETAQIAVQSALTGHFVLSTLHTNNAPSSFIRLKDMGIPDYLIKSTVVGIMAQRLVRRLCSHCSESCEAETQRANDIGWQSVKSQWPQLCAEQDLFKRAVGCDHCNHTGYQGRLAIFELLVIDSRHGDFEIESSSLTAYAKQQNMRTLRQDALLRAALGETSLDEIMRVVG
ncbi:MULTISPECIES: type II/IV secretion system protein [unclassified Motilimonas]|uniref:GspE/PulE family protein n=1 Tax=unclassified Motilimonas TaxID=2643697 RepID=UPI001E3F3BB2|nr:MULTISPECIES: type II/IV secretion system protein [unclassified Motilimonas]MCE0558538.1 Flp pilus assembly complex ATPase component TadA [Motilimonas sp. E26]MDO6527425.1 ATPase, T2SS/T4P/T4SS family [Motilimonas sp. 1_MG-2023]